MKRNKLLTLNAGPLEMLFDSEIGWVRRIRLGGREVVRAIYGAVRDQNWATVPPRLSMLEQRIESDNFHIVFKAVCQSSDVHFEWIGKLTGDKEGTLQFDFEGIAQSKFLKNRIGLCLLHPIAECSGKPCRVKHVDGSETQSNFPSDISPHQPFKNISKISHDIAPGIEAEVAFEGDVFEMEDQRNWTDASFKTYSTPLEIPFPVKMRRSEQIQQRIQIKINGDANVLSSGSVETQKIELDAGMVSRPASIRVGLGLATPIFLHDEMAIERLKALEMNHLSMHVYPSRRDWRNQVIISSQLGAQIGINLHLAVHLGNRASEEFRAFVECLKDEHVPVKGVQIFHETQGTTDHSFLEQAKSIMEGLGLDIAVVAGTDASFAELNRNPDCVGDEAFPCYSINPQVHAFDDMSLMETLEAQSSTVESAWKLFGRPVLVSPVTLKPRFNPNASVKEKSPVAGQLPSQVDPRQSTLFTAAWTLGSLANLLPNPHVHSLTYFETLGTQGIMEHASGSQYPSVFKSIPGGVFPVYHVFRDLAGFSEVSLIDVEEADELACLLLIQGEQQRVLMANLTSESKEIDIQLECLCVSVRTLESNNLQQAMAEPDVFQASAEEFVIPNGVFNMFLSPYAVATIDLLTTE